MSKSVAWPDKYHTLCLKCRKTKVWRLSQLSVTFVLLLLLLAVSALTSNHLSSYPHSECVWMLTQTLGVATLAIVLCIGTHGCVSSLKALAMFTSRRKQMHKCLYIWHFKAHPLSLKRKGTENGDGLGSDWRKTKVWHTSEVSMKPHRERSHIKTTSTMDVRVHKKRLHAGQLKSNQYNPEAV